MVLIMENVDTKEFCDTLRQIGRTLASGEKEVVTMPHRYIENMLGERAAGIINNPSYIRTITGRVPEVKAAGRISLKRKTSDEGSDYFEFSLVRGTKTRVITGDELPEVKAKAVLKFADMLLNLMPNVTHMEGERQAGALEGIKLYQEMVTKLIRDMNH